MTELAVSTNTLTKLYPGRVAVDGLALALPAGAVTGFVGPNGAGKTTTLRMLLGLITPSAGTGTVLGQPLEHPERFLSRVGAMIEGPAFYPALSGRRNLRVLARLGGLPGRRVDEVLELVGLADRQHDRAGSYSLGMKQRLGLAAALLPAPELLILDEPANGLDPAGIHELRTTLRDLADGGVTVIMSSHLLGEVEAVCDHLALIAHGRLVFQGSLSGLTASRQPHLRAVPEHAEDLAGLVEVYEAAGLATQVLDGEVHLRASADRTAWLNRAAFERGITLVALDATQPSLEDAFLALTGAEEEARA